MEIQLVQYSHNRQLPLAVQQLWSREYTYNKEHESTFLDNDWFRHSNLEAQERMKMADCFIVDFSTFRLTIKDKMKHYPDRKKMLHNF